jgi:hypothetical protein
MRAIFDEEPLLAEINLTEGEKALIEGAATQATSQISKTRIWSEIYVAKKVETAIDKLIQSNEKLSESNDRYARAMNYLTGGLLLVTVVEVVLRFI